MENIINDFQETISSPYSIVLQAGLALTGLLLFLKTFLGKKPSGHKYLEDNIPALDKGWKGLLLFFAAYLIASIILGFIIGFCLTIISAIIYGSESEDHLGFSFFITIISIPFIYLLTFLIWKVFCFKDKERVVINTHRISLLKSLKKGFYYYTVIFFFACIAYFGFIVLIDIMNTLGANITLVEQDITTELENLKNPVAIAVFLLFTTILIPIAEEFVFRFGLYRILKSKMGIRMAILLTSIAFVAIHLNLNASPPLFVLAVGLCYSYEKTGNIKVPIMIHILNNIVAMSFVLLG
jgi:membrane protease YdiL (CAAX protease family)